MTEAVVAELAPSGTLRAAINMGNFLLVTGSGPSGDPEGVAPDMARAIADRLGVAVSYAPFASPGELVDAAGTDAWDIGLVGAEPAREKLMAFTAAYAEILATYIVPEDSPFTKVEEVDRAGARIIVRKVAAYGLYLARSLEHADLVVTDTHDEARRRFVDEKFDALAGLRSGLLADAGKMPGVRVLDGGFTSVQQAVGTLKPNKAALAFLSDFVEEAKSSGLVQRLIDKHKVRGLTVAPPA
jgi:polar amino acid transport system substrate-binding protein